MDAWNTAIGGLERWLLAAGASPNTVALRRHYLRRLGRHLGGDPWQVSTDDLLGFLGRGGWAPETRKSIRAAMRALYRYGMATGKITADPSEALPPVKVPRAQPRPAPLPVLYDALSRADERAQLMLLLASSAGLRRAEISRVHTDLIVGDVLWLAGKGGVVRKVPLCPAIMERIDRLPRGYLFPGKIDGHLSANRVGVILSRLLDGPWSGHTLRHQLATRFHAVNHDPLAATRLFGWARVETALIYTDTPIDALRAALFATVAV